MKTTIITLLLAFVTMRGIGADAQKEQKGQDPIVGRWRGDTARVAIFINSDGTASDPTRKGKWVCLAPDATPRKYQINWGNGIWVDTLSLVKGGEELVGHNQDHKKIHWTRLPL